MTNEELAAIAAQRQHIERCRDDLEAAAMEYLGVYQEVEPDYEVWQPAFDKLIAAAIAMREARKGTE